VYWDDTRCRRFLMRGWRSREAFYGGEEALAMTLPAYIEAYRDGRARLDEVVANIRRTFKEGSVHEQDLLLAGVKDTRITVGLSPDAITTITRVIEEAAAERVQHSEGPAGPLPDLATPTSITTRPEPGFILKSRFVLQEFLGGGGMGRVYKALDLRKQEANDRNPFIAIKLIGEEFQRHKDSFVTLQREARKAQSLAHPNIITVYDFDRDGPHIFMTMELLVGSSLETITKEHASSPMPITEALRVINDVGKALAYAHENGIVHCDLKPGNIFITDRGRVKVIDFGIARAMKNVEDPNAEPTRFDPGTLGALTPAYASPEMTYMTEPDPRDDIYALACIAYELFSGKHPFNRVQSMQAMARGLQPAQIKGLDRKQWRGLQHALAFRRELRTSTISQFLDEINPKPRRIRQLVTATGVGGVVVAGLIGGAILLHQASWGPGPPEVAQPKGIQSESVQAQRKADEAAAKAEAQRKADEAAAKAEAQRKADEAAKAEAQRKAAEAAAKAEAQRKADEAAKAEAQRKAAEAAAKAEAQRKADEAAAKAEAQRKADEAAAKAEAQRKADEAAKAEAQRKADEAAKAEAQRKADEAAKAEAQRKAEEAAKAEAQRKADEAAKAEAQRKADEAAAKAEAQRKADETARAEAQRKADEAAKAEAQRKADEAAKAEAQRKADEAAKAEAQRKADEAAKAEAQRKADEAARAEAQRKADEAARAEAQRKADEAARAEAQRKAAEAAKAEVVAKAEVAARPITSTGGEANWTIDEKRAVQIALQTLGYYRGQVDGQFGPGVRDGIQQFRTLEGNSETGDLTETERKSILTEAQRLSALLERPAVSPRGVNSRSITGGPQRYARAWSFETGKGVKVDPAEAIYWYGLAAADGEAKALINLGTMLVRGTGKPGGPDPSDAILLWEAAAARGEPVAMYNLGVLYESGVGVPKDLRRARAWYERAAAHNHQGARASLRQLGG
jgi:serine/threonine protein kinase/TPR repeat protein